MFVSKTILNTLGLEAYSICSLHKYWFEKESVGLVW